MHDSSTRVHILAVSTQTNDILSLACIFDHSSWHCDSATSLDAALGVLAKTPVEVVLCDASLGDGDWRDLLNALSALENPPQMIVTTHDAGDHLWAEVLNLGAYDVLVKPFNEKEVYRTVGNAWRHCVENRRVKLSSVTRLAAAIERHSETRTAATASPSDPNFSSAHSKGSIGQPVPDFQL